MASYAFSIIVLAIFVFNQVSAQNWTLIPTTATWTTGREISCRVHDDIWITKMDGYLSHWVSSTPIWKNELSHPISRVSGSFETNRAWVKNDYSTDQLMRFDGTNWTHVASNDTYTQISAKDYNTLVAVTSRGFVKRYDEGTGWSSNFVFPANFTTPKHCSIGKDGTIWCIDTSRAIWRQNLADQRWTQMVGVADIVDVYDASRVIVVNSNTHEVFRYMIGNKQWTNEYKQLEGGCIQATISDSHIYCVAPGNGLYWARYPLGTF